jgi:hypothetical protein
MKEPDAAATDYLIAVEAAIFVVLIVRSETAASLLRGPFLIFFSATAVAALAGGTVHGFFSSGTSRARLALWRLTLVAVGVVAFAAWTIGAILLLPPAAARVVQMTAAIVAAAYIVIVAVVDDRFGIAMAHYLPPAIFLLIAFSASAVGDRRRSALEGVAGLVLTLAAAVVQLRRIALHPVWFNHNATYHVIQGVGLLLIYRAARALV